jgi:hypothetical protein
MRTFQQSVLISGPLHLLDARAHDNGSDPQTGHACRRARRSAAAMPIPSTALGITHPALAKSRHELEEVWSLAVDRHSRGVRPRWIGPPGSSSHLSALPPAGRALLHCLRAFIVEIADGGVADRAGVIATRKRACAILWPTRITAPKGGPQVPGAGAGARSLRPPAGAFATGETSCTMNRSWTWPISLISRC